MPTPRSDLNFNVTILGYFDNVLKGDKIRSRKPQEIKWHLGRESSGGGEK